MNFFTFSVIRFTNLLTPHFCPLLLWDYLNIIGQKYVHIDKIKKALIKRRNLKSISIRRSLFIDIITDLFDNEYSIFFSILCCWVFFLTLHLHLRILFYLQLLILPFSLFFHVQMVKKICFFKSR